MKLKCRRIKGFKVFVIAIILLTVSFPAVADDTSYTPENGIVEIYSGISDMNDNFYKIKSCSGFIVSNTESSCYIITTYKGIAISSKEKKTCINDNNISDDTYGINEAIKVVVNGDVEANLTKVNKSKKQNFALLQSESVINEKKELKLGNSVENNETVYALGFSSKITYSQFDGSDVTRNEGKVENSAVNLSTGTYIEHSASYDTGCSGGPLINDDGYVVGLNDSSIASDAYYALSIESIKRILKNYNISYSSYDFDQNYSQYSELYDKCKLLCESGNYTSESVEALNNVLSEAQITVNDNPSNEDIENVIKKIKEAKSKLVEKTPTIRIIIYILSGVLITLILWLVLLLIKNYKNTHPEKNNKDFKKKKIDPQNEQNSKQTEQKQYYSAVPQKVYRNIAFIKQPESNLIVKIDKSVFTLGSMIDEVDFAVNNKAVSRKHATIRYIDNHYYIFDDNSVNGTYVNDVMVEEEGKQLKNNDIIALANEQLIFEERLYTGGG